MPYFLRKETGSRVLVGTIEKSSAIYYNAIVSFTKRVKLKVNKVKSKI
jgi:hypothetical protein